MPFVARTPNRDLARQWRDMILPMSRRPSLLLATCLSFLAVQLGGFHVHVDANGNVGDPRGVHLHKQTPHSHGENAHLHHPEKVGHEHPGGPEHPGDPEHGSTDISVAEISSGKWKLSDINVDIRQGLLIGRMPTEHATPVNSGPQPRALKWRWRPPLRAPPALT